MGERDIEEKIVQHCAETLQGIKAASLFVLPLDFGSQHVGQQACAALSCCRTRLATHGIHMIPLTRLKTGIVLYLYRPYMLARILEQPGVRAFLQQAGYSSSDTSACVAQLRQRVRYATHKRSCPMKCAYPHEIGVFLGYPLADVIGFIENEGKNYLLCGCWKVYANAEEASETFHALKECRTCLRERFCAGASIEELIA